MTNVEDFKAVQKAIEFLNIINSMQQGGWRADQPLIAVNPMPGIDMVCGEEFLKEINIEIDKTLKKINRKIHKRIKVVKAESIETVGTVEGLKEELYERFPKLDPNYVEPADGVEGPNKEVTSQKK